MTRKPHPQWRPSAADDTPGAGRRRAHHWKRVSGGLVDNPQYVALALRAQKIRSARLNATYRMQQPVCIKLALTRAPNPPSQRHFVAPRPPCPQTHRRLGAHCGPPERPESAKHVRRLLRARPPQIRATAFLRRDPRRAARPSRGPAATSGAPQAAPRSPPPRDRAPGARRGGGGVA